MNPPPPPLIKTIAEVTPIAYPYGGPPSDQLTWTRLTFTDGTYENYNEHARVWVEG